MPATASTLSPNYTKNRPIGCMTANARATLTLLELLWITNEWESFMGGEEDEDFNVIMERTTHRGTRIWICDRDGIDSKPMLMLPSDY